MEGLACDDVVLYAVAERIEAASPVGCSRFDSCILHLGRLTCWATCPRNRQHDCLGTNELAHLSGRTDGSFWLW
jgi:hypothetical protein